MDFTPISVSDQTKYRVLELLVNSADRVDHSTTPSNLFRVNLVNPISAKIRTYGLKSAIIPKTNYNIPTGRNTIDIQDSTGNATITIPPGQYQLAALVTEIQTQLNALAIDTYTVVYSSLTGKLTFTSDYADFEIDPAAASVAGSLITKLGFAPATTYVAALGVIVSPGVVDISGAKAAFIKIYQLTEYIRNTKNQSYNFKIDLSCGFGGIIFFNNESRYKQYFTTQQFQLPKQSYFDVELVDEHGFAIDLNGLEWSFVLQFITEDTY